MVFVVPKLGLFLYEYMLLVRWTWQWCPAVEGVVFMARECLGALFVGFFFVAFCFLFRNGKKKNKNLQ